MPKEYPSETKKSLSGSGEEPAPTERAMPVYLDYASTTPLDPEVRQAMCEVMGHDANFGNPAAATHKYGWQAQAIVEQARADVAEALDTDAMGVYFTSGATESINLALKGFIAGLWRESISSQRWSHGADLPHVVTSAAEHKATLDALAHLAAEKRITLSILKPSAQGVVSVLQLQEAVRPETVLISLLHVNNELGVINPIQAIANYCRGQGIYLHVDAVQSLGKTDLSVSAWAADMVSFSAHKVYGPKGIGAICLNQALRGQLVPLMHGGGQERGLRPGTVPVHQIVGMAKAFALATANRMAEHDQYQRWRASFLQRLAALPDWVLHSEGVSCVPNILSVGFAGVDGEALLMSLKDVALSSGSACNSVTLDPSHVLTACGIGRELAASTVRISFGRFSTPAQLVAAADHMLSVISRLRS
jgi:cysteine desulfurase